MRDILEHDEVLAPHITALSYTDEDVVEKATEALQRIDSLVATVRIISGEQNGYTLTTVDEESGEVTLGNINIDARIEIAVSELVETNRGNPDAMTSVEAIERIIKVLGTSQELAFFDFSSTFSEQGILTCTAIFRTTLNI